MRQTNKEYFTELRQSYVNGTLDRDDIVEDIENYYCDGIVFTDRYDKMDYVIRLINTWNLFE